VEKQHAEDAIILANNVPAQTQKTIASHARIQHLETCLTMENVSAGMATMMMDQALYVNHVISNVRLALDQVKINVFHVRMQI
jgi:3-phenylpropionate/cinnamic acid dioxygenase small subunit